MAAPTIDAICDAYMADRRDPLADRPCKDPESIACHLVAVRRAFGGMTIDELGRQTKAKVKDVTRQWRREGKSVGTIDKRLRMLKAAIRFAVGEEIITRGQEPLIRSPGRSPPRKRYLDPTSELPALYAALYDPRTPLHIRVFVELAMRLGQRCGAILALTWDMVDFGRGVIRFSATAAVQAQNKRRIDQPLDDELRAILREARARAASPYVVEWAGRGVKCVRGGVRALFRRAGLTDVRIHDFRRSAATYVNAETAGDKKAAAEFLGDTEAVARAHYIQDDPETRRPAVSAISRVIARARVAGAR